MEESASHEYFILRIRKNKLKYLFVAFVLVVAVLVILKPFYINMIAQFLTLSEKKIKSEIIFVMGGQAARRVPEGISLFKADLADKLIIAIGREDSWITDAEKLYGIKNYTQILTDTVLKAEGVTDSKCIFLRDSLSTLDDVRKLRNYYDCNRFKSAIVVTDPIHSRRTMLCIHWCFKDTDVIFHSCPIELKGFREKFADNDDYINYVIDEFLRFIYYSSGLKKDR